MNNKPSSAPGISQDKKEWLEAIEDIYENYGVEGVQQILSSLSNWRNEHSIGSGDVAVNTPYLNTIPPFEQHDYPGELDIEHRIECLLRWNAMAIL